MQTATELIEEYEKHRLKTIIEHAIKEEEQGHVYSLSQSKYVNPAKIKLGGSLCKNEIIYKSFKVAYGYSPV